MYSTESRQLNRAARCSPRDAYFFSPCEARANPPYNQDFAESGDNETFGKPIYNYFLDEVYKIADKVEMIHPARFLFNAGATPKPWNKKMLNDPHLKILYYEPIASNVFPNVGFKGGVAVTYRDKNSNFGAIETYTPFVELNSIMNRICRNNDFHSLNEMILSRTAYRLTEKVHLDFPQAYQKLSKGHLYDMSSNIFELLPEVFLEKAPVGEENYVEILGRFENKRVSRFAKREYINDVPDFKSFKVFVPAASGSGAFGEVLSSPFVCGPFVGRTELYISVGRFRTEQEAQACLKYVKSKFCRAMLGILKVTQHISPEKWKYVPLQDFTENSDIDWSKTIPEIDQQLYKKYGLSEEEIEFIETHVKEMN